MSGYLLNDVIHANFYKLAPRRDLRARKQLLGCAGSAFDVMGHYDLAHLAVSQSMFSIAPALQYGDAQHRVSFPLVLWNDNRADVQTPAEEWLASQQSLLMIFVKVRPATASAIEPPLADVAAAVYEFLTERSEHPARSFRLAFSFAHSEIVALIGGRDLLANLQAVGELRATVRGSGWDIADTTTMIMLNASSSLSIDDEDEQPLSATGLTVTTFVSSDPAADRVIESALRKFRAVTGRRGPLLFGPVRSVYGHFDVRAEVNDQLSLAQAITGLLRLRQDGDLRLVVRRTVTLITEPAGRASSQWPAVGFPSLAGMWSRTERLVRSIRVDRRRARRSAQHRNNSGGTDAMALLDEAVDAVVDGLANPLTSSSVMDMAGVALRDLSAMTMQEASEFVELVRRGVDQRTQSLEATLTSDIRPPAHAAVGSVQLLQAMSAAPRAVLDSACAVMPQDAAVATPAWDGFVALEREHAAWEFPGSCITYPSSAALSIEQRWVSGLHEAAHAMYDLLGFREKTASDVREWVTRLGELVGPEQPRWFEARSTWFAQELFADHIALSVFFHSEFNRYLTRTWPALCEAAGALEDSYYTKLLAIYVGHRARPDKRWKRSDWIGIRDRSRTLLKKLRETGHGDAILDEWFPEEANAGVVVERMHEKAARGAVALLELLPIIRDCVDPYRSIAPEATPFETRQFLSQIRQGRIVTDGTVLTQPVSLFLSALDEESLRTADGSIKTSAKAALVFSFAHDHRDRIRRGTAET